MDFFDERYSARFGDNVVCGSHVGWVIEKGRKTLSIVTKRELVEVPVDARVRPIVPREVAQIIMDAICREGEDSPSIPTPRDIRGNREALIAELALSLRKSERAVRTALRRKDPTVAVPESPWPFAGHEYLGAFRVERGLIIADRCYVDRDKFLLDLRTPALAGTWHAYIRYEPHFEARTVAILVVHGDCLDAAKEPGESLGVFGVDSGSTVVVDQRVLDDPALIDALVNGTEWEEGLIGDIGCFAFTHFGDGMYRARAIQREGAVVAVRVNVSHDEAFDYHDPPPPADYRKALEKEIASAGEAKPYAMTETFVVGDRVAHKKFGEGLVTRIVDAGKVEIAFPAVGEKILLHGQKK